MFNGECKLATIWLYSKDTKKAATFYRDILQMKQIEHGDTDSFDGGELRLSIHPLPNSKKNVPNGECFLVFYVKKGLEKKHEELKKRGVRFIGGIEDNPIGKTAGFKEPDGHEIYLWQPPPRQSKNYKSVSGIVHHYEKVLSKLEH